ncbi:cystatin-B-like [Pygocentrus nattereri]|uniref:cystatin-B-like n=1 Tax=Pygocentrus nattereri TaxID=42514 RepID=UPI00081438A8|nr:cystatin-B-like [Pygocentrus nattereri]
MDQVVGGTGSVQVATPEIQKICDEVKPQVEQKTGKKFRVFVAKSFTTQVVAGTNYFIKVDVGGNDYVHLRVFKPLPHAGHKLQLHGVQTRKKVNESVGYF